MWSVVHEQTGSLHVETSRLMVKWPSRIIWIRRSRISDILGYEMVVPTFAGRLSRVGLPRRTLKGLLIQSEKTSRELITIIIPRVLLSKVSHNDNVFETFNA
jgi:hypothetical protein